MPGNASNSAKQAELENAARLEDSVRAEHDIESSELSPDQTDADFDAVQDSLADEHSGAETLAQSVAMLALMAVLGKGVGFVRSVLFCRWLPEEELGLWDLANGFLLLAAPVAVFGLTGSFRRYLEHFRRQGQARVFLRRVAWVTAICGCLAVIGLIVARDAFSRFVFDTGTAGHLVLYSALALAPLLVFYFAFELFAGLRMFRKVTVLQFIQSISFAVIACIALVTVEASANTVMASYAAATLICAGVAIVWARRAWATLPPRAAAARSGLAHRAMWGKIVPFAMWIWVTNWLANLFEVIDRYMLVHFSRMEEVEALAAVGNYHSARVAPLLLISVAAMLNSALLPHLTADWEAGRREAVAARMRMTLKLVALLLLGGALFILVAAPWLFAYGLSGKYAAGQDVLPLAMIYMIWAGLATLSTTYLWCAERAKLGSLALVVGLMLNVTLNLLLVPSFGLYGAVTATCVANGVTLAVIHVFTRRLGLDGNRTLLVLFCAPLVLLLGPLATAGVLIVLAHQAITRNWLLSEGERTRLNEIFASGITRLRRLFRRSEAPAA